MAASQELVKTREELIEEKSDQQEKINKSADSHKKIRVRLIPIWMRLGIIAVLLALGVLLGAIIGYSVLGSGKVSDTFSRETWTHIIDLVNKK